MAVTLDFQLDADALAEDRQSDLSAVDPAVLETTYFMVPVRFSVDETELLATSSGVWLEQPLLGLATHMSLSMGILRSTGEATCSVAGAGTLRLQQRGDQYPYRVPRVSLSQSSWRHLSPNRKWPASLERLGRSSLDSCCSSP